MSVLKKMERINDYYIVVSIPFLSYAEADLNLHEHFLKKNSNNSYAIFKKGNYWYVCEKW